MQPTSLDSVQNPSRRGLSERIFDITAMDTQIMKLSVISSIQTGNRASLLLFCGRRYCALTPAPFADAGTQHPQE